MRTSMRSFAVGLLGLGAIAVVRTLVALGVAGAVESSLLSDVGGGGIASIASVLVLVFASLMKAPVARRHWLMLGIAALAFAAGDVLWAIAQFGTGEVPYPGMPDLFYLTGYVFLTIALIRAALTMRHGGDARSALLLSGLTCVVALAVLYFGLIAPLLIPAGLSALELNLSVFYLVVDAVLVVAPGVFLLVLAFRSGDRGVMIPWGMVGLSLALMALSDATFAWMSAAGTYVGGSLVDYGWMASRVAMAVAASFALDADADAMPAREWASQQLPAEKRDAHPVGSTARVERN